MSDGSQSAPQTRPNEQAELIEPLVPVSEVDESTLPVIVIPPSRRKALAVIGAKRAKDSRGTISQHEQGIFGEFAVAKYLGIPEQIDKEIYENGDPGFDILFQDKRIDVKTVGPHVNNPFLPVSTHGDLTADFYVLIHQLNQSNYRIFGYAHRIQVSQSRTMKFTHDEFHSFNRYDDEVYVVEQDSLTPITRLWE